MSLIDSALIPPTVPRTSLDWKTYKEIQRLIDKETNTQQKLVELVQEIWKCNWNTKAKSKKKNKQIVMSLRKNIKKEHLGTMSLLT